MAIEARVIGEGRHRSPAPLHHRAGISGRAFSGRLAHRLAYANDRYRLESGRSGARSRICRKRRASTFRATSKDRAGDAFDVRYVIDDAPQPPFHVVIPAGGGLALWDHSGDPIAPGAHSVRLEARAAATSILTLEQVEAASAPVTLQSKTLSSFDATNSGSLGTEHQPLNCLDPRARRERRDGRVGRDAGVRQVRSAARYDASRRAGNDRRTHSTTTPRSAMATSRSTIAATPAASSR